MLAEGLTYFKNYQNGTQRQEMSKLNCAGEMVPIDFLNGFHQTSTCKKKKSTCEAQQNEVCLKC